ncbi:MAG TPA: T9SS type A sorting domain-containing protein, partial [Flavitalea sp.]|nr:T9SS type A sorting domain-containing protein [Flavitalea sp.]
PNPFRSNTVISYYIPENAGHAQIRIVDINGRLIKTFNAPKGEGQIVIRSGELSAGTYSYTLFVNNKRVDTKQMVLLGNSK